MLRDTLRELGSELRAHKLRTLLSLLGMTWGTLALLLLLAFSFGFEELFAERARGLGDAVAIAWPRRTTVGWLGFPAGRQLVIRRADALALPSMVPELHSVSAEYSITERVRVGTSLHRVPISGVDPPFASMRLLLPQSGGRFLNERDLTERARVVFLGDVLARSLFSMQDPIGRTLLLRGVPFRVVGCLRPKLQDSDYGGEDKDRAYVPATTFLQVFGDRGVTNLVFRAEDPRRQALCTAAVVRALAARLRFDPNDLAALSVWDTTEQQRMMHYIFLGFHVMLGIAGAFTLLVGGLGVAHLMQLMVRRRTAEIGLKLAFGAPPARLRAEWLLQAFALVIAGGGGGVLLAAAAIAAVGHSPATEQVGTPYVPPGLAIATAALLGGIAFLAGFLPARTASRLDPVEALREGT